MKARKDFLQIVDSFSGDKQNVPFLGKWTLKDILAHINNWDNYLLESLYSLQNGTKCPYWGKIQEFNEKGVNERKNKNWSQLRDEFIKLGLSVIGLLKKSPDLLDIRYWPNKKYTPAKFLEIESGHYLNHIENLNSIKRSWIPPK